MPLIDEGSEQIVLGTRRHSDLQHEQGDGDGEHAVAERLQPPRAQLPLFPGRALGVGHVPMIARRRTAHSRISPVQRRGGASVRPMATPPTLSPEDRAKALEKAKQARAARAEIKARLKMGSLSLKSALESDDNNVGKLKVKSMLESLPGVGKVKAQKVMDEIGIADNRRIQGLGSQQRQALLAALG